MDRQLVMFPPRRPLLERFGADFFRQIPERPGVYLMCGASAGVLYVGKAKNLRQRLASYRSADLDQIPRKLRRLLCAVERIVWDECTDESAALDRESELLQAMRPRFNAVGVRPRMPDYLGWQVADGGLKFGLGAATTNWPERHGPDVQSRRIYGPLLRSLWWALHPTARWDQMPARLRKTKVPASWTFSVEADSCEEARRRLTQFFRGESPELAEWCVWSTARRPLFERTWAGSDALALWEFYEHLIGTAGGDGFVTSLIASPEHSTVENSNAPFPLTPALSLGERESTRPRVSGSDHPASSDASTAERGGRTTWVQTFTAGPKPLPLPKGEGRGEGEGSIQPATISISAKANERPS